MRLTDCFMEIMAYTAYFLKTVDQKQPPYEQVKADVLRSLTRSEECLKKDPSLRDDYDLARFAVCAWVDESILNSAWKEKNPGGLAVGHMPVYVPRPLLEAIHCLPVAIFGGGEIDIIRGDSYFQSYICHIPRSTVELALAGDLAVLDGIPRPPLLRHLRNLPQRGPSR